MRNWSRFFHNFISLFYPRLCLACGRNIPPNQNSVCVGCQYHLPKTHFHLQKENAFTERFWGRISLHTGTSLYYFSKGGRTQKLIHHLKYHNKQNIGVKLGNLLGGFLSEAPLYQDVDLIIPVPLHAKRERFRGYNQSDLFAKGLSEAMQIQWQKNILVRNQMTDTQTKKSRIDRFKNVENAFSVVQPQAIQNKHILIVDDVLTTGATLEACANQILKIPGTTVSLATIAFAEN